MLTKFWEGLGSKLAERWVSQVLTPAFVFWAGGLAAWVWGHLGDVIRREGWEAALDQAAETLQGLPTAAQVGLLVAVLLGLVVSAVVAERVTLPLLRLLEGYWPWGRPKWLSSWLVTRNVRRRASAYGRAVELAAERDRQCLTSDEYQEFLALRERLAAPAVSSGWFVGWRRNNAARPDAGLESARWRLSELTGRRDGHGLAPEERVERCFGQQKEAELARLEERLRRMPTSETLMMPTRLGNILRAAEERPRVKHGLDPVVCWPHLWLVMDKEARDEIVQARSSLDAAVKVWLWGALFAVWTIWAWWAVLVALVVTVSAYRVSLLSAAEVHGDLVEAAFDLYQSTLYKALRWPLPGSPAEEVEYGEAVTQYLWRGSDQPSPIFEPGT
jgi:hypothetical protein